MNKNLITNPNPDSNPDLMTSLNIGQVANPVPITNPNLVPKLDPITYSYMIKTGSDFKSGSGYYSNPNPNPIINLNADPITNSIPDINSGPNANRTWKNVLAFRKNE
jgi:hypothetical protein